VIPHQLTAAKLMVKRYQYKHAKSDRRKELIEQKAKIIKRQMVSA
jgi:hypothetical protein